MAILLNLVKSKLDRDINLVLDWRLPLNCCLYVYQADSYRRYVSSIRITLIKGSMPTILIIDATCQHFF